MFLAAQYLNIAFCQNNVNLGFKVFSKAVTVYCIDNDIIDIEIYKMSGIAITSFTDQDPVKCKEESRDDIGLL